MDVKTSCCNATMTVFCEGMETKIKCPACSSEALYRYGKGRTGKQRFLCLICHRQFTHGAERTEVKDRPNCPECAMPMHLYKQDARTLRFRCSRYPRCRTFEKAAK